MKIGFVSTWFERGAAYVTKQYADLLKAYGHDIFVYARGENYAKGDPKWDLDYVTWAPRLYDTNIDFHDFSKWIKRNKLDIVFFNEQRDMKAVIKLKKSFSDVRVGTYIDYYRQNSIKDFKWYDFLICNTKRHYSVFCEHNQCFYVPWGTNINLFNRKNQDINREGKKVVFFHSAGMSNRKGTDVLIKCFIENDLYKDAKLIIHTQLPINKLTKEPTELLSQKGIEVIEKTVSAPGLYHLGDVYVYPTTLDGLGLTVYEALAMHMPVIATDCAPMNEVVNDYVGKLVSVNKYVCRWDAYYWPLAYVDENSLLDALKFYIIHADQLDVFKERARDEAEKKYNWDDRGDLLNQVFENVHTIKHSDEELISELKSIKREKMKQLGKDIIDFMPPSIQKIMARF